MLRLQLTFWGQNCTDGIGLYYRVFDLGYFKTQVEHTPIYLQWDDGLWPQIIHFKSHMIRGMYKL